MRISDWSSDVCSSDLVWDLTSQFRFRGTRSRDIRAPNIVELDSPSKQKGTTITDPTLNNAAFVINTFEQGNPALKPEIADTITLGLVYRPTASSGLRASVDGYDLKKIGGAACRERVGQYV